MKKYNGKLTRPGFVASIIPCAVLALALAVVVGYAKYLLILSVAALIALVALYVVRSRKHKKDNPAVIEDGLKLTLVPDNSRRHKDKPIMIALVSDAALSVVLMVIVLVTAPPRAETILPVDAPEPVTATVSEVTATEVTTVATTTAATTATTTYAETATESPTPELPQYTIALVEDISVGSSKRFSISVVVTEECTPKQLEEVSKEIVEKTKAETPFNAISLGFYDYPEYIGRGYTLGSATYAPYGDWSKAASVETGEYFKMSFDFDFKKKNWEYHLSADEVEIWKAWFDAFDKAVTPEKLPDESAITSEVAGRYGVTTNRVEDIMLKQSMWVFSKA